MDQATHDSELELRGSTLSFQGRSTRLTSLEEKLALALGAPPLRRWSYRELVKPVWDHEFSGPADTEKLQTLVARFRDKLKDLGLPANEVLPKGDRSGYRMTRPVVDRTASPDDTPGSDQPAQAAAPVHSDVTTPCPSVRHPARIGLGGAALLASAFALSVVLLALARAATLASADFEGPNTGASPLVLADWAGNQGATETVEGGEYVLRTPPAGPEAAANLEKAFERADIVVVLDARVEGDPTEVFVGLNCRFTGPSEGYGFAVIPGTGEFVLGRYEGQGKQPTDLKRRQEHSSIRRRNNTNRLELSCVGDTITARINGEEVASEQDDRYRQGGVWLGVGAYAPTNPRGEVHFDNLVVRDCAWWARPATHADHWLSRGLDWLSHGSERGTAQPRC